MRTFLSILSLLCCTTVGVSVAVCVAGALEPAAESVNTTTDKKELPEIKREAALVRGATSDILKAERKPAIAEAPLPGDVFMPEPMLESIAPGVAEVESPRPKVTFTALNGTELAQQSPTIDISQMVKALQSSDPAAMQQLQNAATSGNSAMINQLLQVPGLDKILGSPEAVNTLKNLAAPQPAQMPLSQAPGGGPSLASPTSPHEELPSPVKAPRHTITHVPSPEGDDQLTISMQDEDIREVLELLSEQGDLNILATDNVQGKVSAVLKNVDVLTALDAIVKSAGFVLQRDGKFIYVGTSKDFADLKMALDRIGTRVYRPNYVTAKELQVLLTPLLSSGVGRIGVTAPAAVGISIDTNSAGGDAPAHGEGVLVQDYEAVLTQVDEVVQEIDRRPMQVHIEAMIIAVTLNDATTIGVNMQWLRNEPNVRFGSGAPRINPLNGSGIVDPTTGGLVGQYTFTNGLQFAFLDQSLGAFLTMLETIGDINVVATPRLLCLNKQRAEILIGSQIPYTTSTVTQTFTTQTVQFLDIGTQLRLRPYISSDGSIRMEIHPEISSEGPVFNNVPSKNLTQVTTNVMCYDGCTIVIGGLMQEDLNTTITQIPYLGSLPLLGPFFRQKSDTIVRREILVLLTPRIVYDAEYGQDSVKRQDEFERRQVVSADSESIVSRTVSARRMIRRAEELRANGDIKKARRYAILAVRFDPNNRAAIALRDELNAVTPKMQGALALEHGGGVMPGPFVPPVPGAGPGPAMPGPAQALDGDAIAPMLLDDLQGVPMMPQPLHPLRPGIPGHIQDIPKPHLFGEEPY